MSKQTNSDERIKARIELEAIEFPGTTESTLMSTITMSKYINTCLNKVFKDYMGCKIYPMLNDGYSALHPVRCDLYFTLGGDNLKGSSIAAFRQIGTGVTKQVTGNRANYTAMISDHNARLSSLNCAEITQEAIDCIHPLLFNEIIRSVKETPEGYRNSTVVREQTTQVPYSTQEVVTPIISLVDIAQLMKLLFEGSATEKSAYEYMVQPIRSINMLNPQPGMYNGTAWGENFLYNISRLDKDMVLDVCNEIGYISRTGNADCFTDSF